MAAIRLGSRVAVAFGDCGCFPDARLIRKVFPAVARPSPNLF
jgi:hypothetical protein